MNAIKMEKYYSYADWLEIDDGNRYELVDGVLYMMASPATRHQAILMEVSRQIANFLVGKPCKVFPALFDVRLVKNKDKVFIPDITVICDPKKIKPEGCEGAPDFIAEILSPGNRSHDTILKLNEYRDAGVKEYWIIDPDEKALTAYSLKQKDYIVSGYTGKESAPVKVLPGLSIDLNLVFGEETES